MAKHQRRRQRDSFLALPKHIINGPVFKALTGKAVKALIQLGEQFNGSNNGDLQAAYSVFQAKGWRSKSTLRKALQELLDAGLIEQTRQGWLRPRRCNLYALTWLAIDDCQGKLDVQPTRVPSNLWRK
ncbi:hypothetical protein OAC78_00540 [Litorivicinus sp.]|nr:hypothetical protein [Litorivicinus sp.]